MKQQSNFKAATGSTSTKFEARHPMFQYEIKEPNKDFCEFLEEGAEVVVVGMGGSSLPLKVFVDFFDLQEKIILLDTLDLASVQRRVSSCNNPVFCIVSKSGGTLEVAALLSHLLEHFSLDRFAVVTDPEKGLLREWAMRNSRPQAPVPSEIGGRFTNFIGFHSQLLKKFGVDVDGLFQGARQECQSLQNSPEALVEISAAMDERLNSTHILWAYGKSVLGLGQWMQQALAESLGKIAPNGKRYGSLPCVLSGPEDQHSVLQLLTDGPQDKLIWFLDRDAESENTTFRSPPKEFSYLKGQSLDSLMKLLCDATYQSFSERNEDPKTYQPLLRWSLENRAISLGRAIARVQALVEYRAQILNIDAFDQPGVEHGKRIARSKLGLSA